MDSKKVFINPEETPLKYFKFLRVSLMLALIVRILQAINLFTCDPTWYDIGFSAVGFALTLAAAVGLNTMQWYGVRSLFGLHLLTVLDGVFAAVIISVYDLSEPSFGSAIGQILGASIVFIPTWIYFAKRRLLFDPRPRNASEILKAAATTSAEIKCVSQFQNSSGVPSTNKQYTSPTEQPVPKAHPQIQFCRKCGARLLEDSVFCSYCGTAIMEDTNNVLP